MKTENLLIKQLYYFARTPLSRDHLYPVSIGRCLSLIAQWLRRASQGYANHCPWSGGHGFELWYGRTWGTWYFCLSRTWTKITTQRPKSIAQIFARNLKQQNLRRQQTGVSYCPLHYQCDDLYTPVWHNNTDPKSNQLRKQCVMLAIETIKTWQEK